MVWKILRHPAPFELRHARGFEQVDNKYCLHTGTRE
ncbi:hypothetical protein PspLS_08615 [Pyricularia sp. CBS 133598]|nr:hypothetical protein PspLS_08615 [Pyricularia sp. CBS 133598]